MEQKLKEIIRQVGDIGEKISRLNADDTLSSIELDIILGDIRVLYENIKDLQQVHARAEPSTRTPVQEPSVEPAASEQASVPETESAQKETATAGEQTSVPETASVQKETAAAGKQSAKAAKPGKSAQARKTSEPAILADKYKGEKKFINEKLAGTREESNISSKIQSKPIPNIGSALGINDRFKLINDLFKGDKESFQNTIVILDGASNFNEAFNYISTSFDWDMEDDSVQMLLDLVRRKFIVNQNE